MRISEFSKFGVDFKPLSEENLEMIRVWRNSNDVRLFMQYQEIITPQKQEIWFTQLDKETNYYFVTYMNKIPFGVYNIKDVDFHKGIGESGVFLSGSNIWESDSSMRGSIGIIIFAFEILRLETLKCHVLKSNKKALVFNQQMGFKILDLETDSISFELMLTKQDFYANKKISRLIKYLEIN